MFTNSELGALEYIKQNGIMPTLRFQLRVYMFCTGPVLFWALASLFVRLFPEFYAVPQVVGLQYYWDKDKAFAYDSIDFFAFRVLPFCFHLVCLQFASGLPRIRLGVDSGVPRVCLGFDWGLPRV